MNEFQNGQSAGSFVACNEELVSFNGLQKLLGRVTENEAAEHAAHCRSGEKGT